MSDQPFTFEGCDSPSSCRDGIRPLLAAGKDWSEVHCGRCGKAGIVRHADLLDDASAENPDTSEADDYPLIPVEPAPEPEADASPAKGRSR